MKRFGPCEGESEVHEQLSSAELDKLKKEIDDLQCRMQDCDDPTQWYELQTDLAAIEHDYYVGGGK